MTEPKKKKMKLTEVSKKRKAELTEAPKKKMKIAELLPEKRKAELTEVPKKKMKFTEGGFSVPEKTAKCRHIQDDLISKILQRLPARSIGKFRSVCLSWLSATTSPSFVRAHAKHIQSAHQSIVLQKSELELCIPRELDFYLASASDKPSAGTSLRKWSEMNLYKTSCIKASCDGLMVICIWSKGYKKHVMVNPITGRSINLPNLNDENSPDLTEYSIYFHRSTSKYRILAMYSQAWSYILTVGTNSWRRISVRRPADPLHPHPIDVDGNLHWLAYTCKEMQLSVLVFNKERGVFSLISLPTSEESDDRGGSLVDFHGELGFWTIDSNCTINLWIMKKHWIKGHSIICSEVQSCFCKSRFKHFGTWVQGTAVRHGDGELLIQMNASTKLQYLIRWNLDFGTCVVQSFCNNWVSYLPAYPYIESLIDPTISPEAIDS